MFDTLFVVQYIKRGVTEVYPVELLIIQQHVHTIKFPNTKRNAKTKSFSKTISNKHQYKTTKTNKHKQQKT
jgi:hypothetical protein